MKITFTLFLMCFLSIQAFGQEKTVRGIVYDEQGLPLPGANVIIKGTVRGTQTDFDGKFLLKVNSDQTLVFSYQGFETKEMPVGNRESFVVNMIPMVSQLEEVVVAFRVQKKEAVTGATDAVDTKLIEQVPVASLDQLFQGNVAGISATATNGNPGARSEVFIRGVNSPTGGSEPIYLLDGVRITSAIFRALNPNDFEDINFLKDPASAALYGARGANGIVLITSKKGRRNQDATIEYSGTTGFSSLQDNPNYQLMNGEQYRRYRNILSPGTFTDAEIEEARNNSTDWFDVFLRNPTTTNHQLSFTGGSEKMSYFISGSYFSQDGIIERSGLERTTLRVNVSGDVKEWLTIGTNLTLGYATEKLADDFGVNTNSPILQAYVNRPDTPAFNPDGTINNAQTLGFNALEQTRINSDNRSDLKIVGNIFAKVRFSENFRYELSLGMDYNNTRRDRFFRPGTNLGNQADNGELLINGDVDATFYHNSKFTYDLEINENNKLTLLGGMEFERFRDTDLDVGVQNFDFPLGVPDAGTNFNSITGQRDNATFINYFFNADYALNDKYFFTGSFSYGADSDFNALERFDAFYSFGFSWLLSKESFLKDSKVVDYLKLRTSYGVTGNNQSAALYASGNFLTIDQYNRNAGLLSVFNLNDPSVGWEVVTGYNVGVDFELFKKVKGTVEAYYKETTELTFQRPVPPSTTVTGGGGGQILTNTDDYSIVNKGIEVDLSYNVLGNEQEGITIGGNFSYNRNTVEGEGRPNVNADNEWFGDGELNGTWYLVRYAGVNPANGDALWYDANGNLTNTFDEDNNAVILSGKSPFAPINGGFYGIFKYKGFDLDARFSYQFDKYILNNSRFFNENTNFPGFNQSVTQLNIWQQPGDVTDVPRNGIGSQFDTRYLENASFLRLRSVTLSYNFPQRFLDKTPFKSLRIYAQGQNLITWTNYQGFDPELNDRFDGYEYPVVSSFLFGVNFKL